MRKPNHQWSSDFYRLVEDFSYEVLNEEQFREGLYKLGFWEAQAEWLIVKMTENRSPLLDE